MYLHSLKLKNFRGFRGESQEIVFHGPNGTPGSGLNLLVGENNAGKSTLLRAISFLHNASFEEKNPTSIAGKEDPTQPFDNIDEVGVIGEFAETSSDLMLRRIEAFVKPEDLSSVQKLLTSDTHIRCRRLWHDDSQYRRIAFLKEGNGFNAKLHSSNILDLFLRGMVCIHTFGFENKSNDDKTYVFNKTCRSFLKDILQTAEKTNEYRLLKKAVNSVFGNPNSSLRRDISDVEASITSQFQNYFGAGSLHFEFEQPTMDQLLDSLSLIVDLDCPLALSEHGQGAQRIAELAVLTAWASKEANIELRGLKIPFIFLLDEPEICLHPSGQERLLQALLKISQNHQVFVTTHSPIFLHSPDIRNANLLLCRKVNGTTLVQPQTEFANTFKFSPTWGEICWYAYNMKTTEFHDELFGHLQDRCGDTYIASVDKLIKQSLKEMQKKHVPYIWTKLNQNGVKVEEKDRTLSYCVRNAIHHPDNPFIEEGFVENHLEESIKELLDVVNHLHSKEAPSA